MKNEMNCLRYMELINKDLHYINFKNNPDVNQLFLSVSNALNSLNLDSIEYIRTSLLSAVDVIQDTIDRLFEKKDENLQNLFIIGELSGLFKIVNESYKIVKSKNRFDADLNNAQLSQMIDAIWLKKSISHKDLAKLINTDPASLSMRIKRHPSWAEYYTVYSNPNKKNSVIYVLSNKGKEAYSELHSRQIWDIEFKNPFQKNFETIVLGGENEYDSKRIRSACKPFEPAGW